MVEFEDGEEDPRFEKEDPGFEEEDPGFEDELHGMEGEGKQSYRYPEATPPKSGSSGVRHCSSLK